MRTHVATVWESIADAIPEESAVTHGDLTRTWAEYDERAARIAGVLDGAGLGPDSKTALYMYNCNEYMEAQYATFKSRGVSVNVNYRYLDDELWYLLDNSDSEALFFHSSLGDRVAGVVDRLPNLKLIVEIDDGEGAGRVSGAQPYEDVLAGHDPALRIERSPDDIYMLYTGGTTGMPKGVMYAIGDFSGNPGADADVSSSPGALARAAAKEGTRKISLTCAPLMHGTGMLIGCFEAHLVGGQVITLTNRSLDPHEVLDTIERHRVTMLTIVGDSFAKPLIRALDEGRPDGSTYGTSSIDEIVSAGVMWTVEVKQQLLDRIEQASLYDAMAASEGAMGFQISTKGGTNETARFQVAPTTKVFTEDDREVQPGSEEIGMVAAGGRVPLGYYKDPEKSARTFRVVDGVRYSFPGDFAKVAEDGSLILLGRGSQVINSGGEKIFPEEVEEAVKRVDGVVDCLVVGIKDDRFGQAVTAVVSVAEGMTVDSATIIASVKQDLAGFKAPRSVVFVDQIPRAPNGKADYRRAREYAKSPTP